MGVVVELANERGRHRCLCRYRSSTVAKDLPPKLLDSPSLHPGCCCIAGALRCRVGRQRPQLKPLSSWVSIAASYLVVRHRRNRARFTDNCFFLS
ncbi:hypothetical protein S245_040539 [Arachis hypogaea]